VISRAGLDRQPAAVLLGGFGGTFVGAEALDAPYSPDGLRPFGGSVGAGVIVVFDEDDCGIHAVAQLTRWMAEESAGQCGPCVFGLPSIADDLEDLLMNRGSGSTLERIGARCDLVMGRGACAHPDGVARMVTTGLSAFAADAHHHASRQPCRGSAPRLVLPSHDQPLEWR
jgi:NADH:ubiquinone oxidoreductase subunit F (NADH-binding)